MPKKIIRRKKQKMIEIKPYVRKTQFYETDQMAIIHHANYIRWFEEARVDLMEQMGYGYERTVKEGIDIAVLGVECEYKSMVRFGDTVLIECKIISIKNMRMTIGYKITDSITGELRTTGESRHCFFSRERNRPVGLKKTLPELYELIELLVE